MEHRRRLGSNPEVQSSTPLPFCPLPSRLQPWVSLLDLTQRSKRPGFATTISFLNEAFGVPSDVAKRLLLSIDAWMDKHGRPTMEEVGHGEVTVVQTNFDSATAFEAANTALAGDLMASAPAGMELSFQLDADQEVYIDIAGTQVRMTPRSDIRIPE